MNPLEGKFYESFTSFLTGSPSRSSPSKKTDQEIDLTPGRSNGKDFSSGADNISSPFGSRENSRDIPYTLIPATPPRNDHSGNSPSFFSTCQKVSKAGLFFTAVAVGSTFYASFCFENPSGEKLNPRTYEAINVGIMILFLARTYTRGNQELKNPFDKPQVYECSKGAVLIHLVVYSVFFFKSVSKEDPISAGIYAASVASGLGALVHAYQSHRTAAVIHNLKQRAMAFDTPNQEPNQDSNLTAFLEEHGRSILQSDESNGPSVDFGKIHDSINYHDNSPERRNLPWARIDTPKPDYYSAQGLLDRSTV